MIEVTVQVMDIGQPKVYEKVYTFSTKQKACDEALQIAKTFPLGWGRHGNVTVTKNGNFILSLPIEN